MALNDPAYLTALEQRYASQSRPANLLWNETVATLLSHKSVRAYLARPLAEGTIETLIAAAQSASSSSNLNLVSVIAVTDESTKSRLAALAGNQKHIVQAPLLLLWVADLSRAARLGERQDAVVEGLDYLDSFVTAAVDAGIAAQNAVVAAESLGLGTVYIGALRNRPEDVAAVVGLPPRSAVVFGLVIGWPDPELPASIKPRPSQEAILHKNQFSDVAEAQALDAYEEAIRDFQRTQDLPATGWKSAVLSRFANGAALNGRDRLKGALATLGFKLL
jgi:nitroreductase